MRDWQVHEPLSLRVGKRISIPLDLQSSRRFRPARKPNGFRFSAGKPQTGVTGRCPQPRHMRSANRRAVFPIRGGVQFPYVRAAGVRSFWPGAYGERDVSKRGNPVFAPGRRRDPFLLLAGVGGRFDDKAANQACFGCFHGYFIKVFLRRPACLNISNLI